MYFVHVRAKFGLTSRHGLHRKHHSSLAVYGQLPSNGRCIAAYFAIVAQQRVYMPQDIDPLENTGNYLLIYFLFNNA
jgi:hypothetical protein